MRRLASVNFYDTVWYHTTIIHITSYSMHICQTFTLLHFLLPGMAWFFSVIQLWTEMFATPHTNVHTLCSHVNAYILYIVFELKKFYLYALTFRIFNCSHITMLAPQIFNYLLWMKSVSMTIYHHLV